MASGPATLEIGVKPVLARIQSDPSFYYHADTNAKAAVERAVAEEQHQMYFTSGKTVYCGPIPATALTAWDTVQGDHTAIWHLVSEDNTIKIVYVYAHVEVDKGAAVLIKVLKEEMKAAEKDGRLRNGAAFGIMQAGLKMGFFEYCGSLVPLGHGV